MGVVCVGVEECSTLSAVMALLAILVAATARRWRCWTRLERDLDDRGPPNRGW